MDDNVIHVMRLGMTCIPVVIFLVVWFASGFVLIFRLWYFWHMATHRLDLGSCWKGFFCFW